MTKDRVLAMLRHTEGYLSGEEMSRVLGVSRMAINTAIKALREEGYTISASTNKGYCLKDGPNILSTGELMALLPEERMARIVCLPSVGSTNNYLRGLAEEGAPAGQIVIANEQTAGKGRRGRSFLSPKNCGIYFSMLLRPDSAPADTAAITAWTAVAIGAALEATCGVQPGIKWVNDLVLNKKKICGILTEMSVESESGRIQYIIVGIGVNVNHAAGDFSEELRDIAGSLYTETGRQFSRAQIAAEMVRKMDLVCQEWPHEKQAYLEAYRKRCISVGHDVRLQYGSSAEAAFAEAVDDDFGLIVRLADGSYKHVASGEVSVRGLYGYV